MRTTEILQSCSLCLLPLSLAPELQKLIKNEYFHSLQDFYELERVCIRKPLQKHASVEASKLIVVIFGMRSVRIPVGIPVLLSVIFTFRRL